MNINWMPEYFNQRRPKTSYLMGQAMGETLGKASDLYLGNKIQGYFDQQKEDRIRAADLEQSEAIASLPQLKNYKGLGKALAGMPGPQKVALVNSLLSNPQGPESNILNKLISGGKFEAPEAISQSTPTPATIAANQAAAQRMGMANQPPQIPGMPSYAQPGQQGPLPFLMPQYQPAMDSEETPMTPAGVVPPEPNEEPGNGLDLASFQGKRLGEMSREQLDSLKQGQPLKTQKAIEREARAQQGLSTQQERLGLEKEKFTWQKSEKEIEKAREGEQKNVQSFIEGAQEKAAEVPVLQSLLNVAKSSISTGNFGLLSPDHLADLTHIEAFRTATGEALRTVTKEYTFSEVRSLGARNNQMLDKQLLSVIPNVGKSVEGNLAWTEIQQMKLDLALAPNMFINELRKDHLDKNGYPKQSLIDDVNKHVIDYANKVQEQTAYKIQEINEMNSDLSELQSLKKVHNTYLTQARKDALIDKAYGDKEKAIKAAIKLGYKIPDRDVYEINK